jgi:tripartite motif-containing protein 71
MREPLLRLRRRSDLFRARRCFYRRREQFRDGRRITILGPFARPFDIKVDGNGFVYVTEFAGHRVVRLTPGLEFDGWLGGGTRGWSAAHAPATPGSGAYQFRRPHAVAIDEAGDLYVTDLDNHCIHVFSPDGVFRSSIGHNLLRGPASSEVTPSRDVLVCDAIAGSVLRLSADGRLLRRLDGFNQPHSVIALESGILLVSDTWNHRIVRIDTDEARTDFAGTDGETTAPVTIARDDTGGYVVAAFGDHRIYRFGSNGKIRGVFGGNRPGCDAGFFRHPYGVCVADGNLFVADTENNRIQIIHQAVLPTDKGASSSHTFGFTHSSSS